MKIFAFNFRIQLQKASQHGHFRFERSSLPDVAAKLRSGGQLFEDQVFYVDANSLSPRAVVNLLKDPDLAPVRAELVLVFDTGEQVADFASALRDSFEEMPAAGGLVRSANGALLLILRNGFWDLPKGKLEKGEEVEEAALREVREETGLESLEMGNLAKTTWHVFERKGRWRWKQTSWFWMAGDASEPVHPQAEEGITEVRWWSLEELREDMPRTFPQIEDLLRLHVEREGQGS